MHCSHVMEATIFDSNLPCMESITLWSTSLQRTILRCSTFPPDTLPQVLVAWWRYILISSFYSKDIFFRETINLWKRFTKLMHISKGSVVITYTAVNKYNEPFAREIKRWIFYFSSSYFSHKLPFFINTPLPNVLTESTWLLCLGS